LPRFASAGARRVAVDASLDNFLRLNQTDADSIRPTKHRRLIGSYRLEKPR